MGKIYRLEDISKKVLATIQVPFEDQVYDLDFEEPSLLSVDTADRLSDAKSDFGFIADLLFAAMTDESKVTLSAIGKKLHPEIIRMPDILLALFKGERKISTINALYEEVYGEIEKKESKEKDTKKK